MACDIHLYVETKRTVKEEKVWVSADLFILDPYDKGNLQQVELHGNRNYNLFSTLAGVRDHTGKITPVSKPKGLPSDCCQYVRTQCEKWSGDGHTHSYLTLKELRDYQNSNPVLYESGLITLNQAKELDEQNKIPTSWCKWSIDDNFVYREWPQPNLTLVPLIEKLEQRYQLCFFYGHGVYNQKNDEDIRIVFWFDN